MDENQGLAGQDVPATATGENDTSAGVEKGNVAPDTKVVDATGKGTAGETFTQSQVNDIVRERLDRAGKKYLERYGVSSDEELEGLVSKARSVDDLQKANRELTEKIAFMEADISPERLDDAQTWFRGKGMEVTKENLATALESHPEWKGMKQAPVIEIGKSKNNVQPEKTSRDLAEELYGMKFVD